MERLVDNHTHSCFSTDSKMELDDAVRVAQEAGLRGIVFTDHIDLGIPAGGPQFNFDIPSQQEAIDAQIEKNREISPEFHILKGVEIGVDLDSMPLIGNILKNHRFDTVIASQHLIEGFDPYYGGYYDSYTYKEAYGRYLEVFYKGITTMKDFDILGHYDYIVRYASYPQVSITYSDFGDILDTIFRYLIENGKVFEINTKTYQLYKGRTPVLDIELLKRFKELGGEAISFGSDAHNISRIAEKFDWCREIALSAGLKYEAFFKERKPQYISL
ncbi:MAG: histidinol-phosphatase HisJ family protein [Bacteroidales bacterium]|nr:histidinol-phosphatase HisJ family protein [Bacteroidales bacterium]